MAYMHPYKKILLVMRLTQTLLWREGNKTNHDIYLQCL